MQVQTLLSGQECEKCEQILQNCPHYPTINCISSAHLTSDRPTTFTSHIKSLVFIHKASQNFIATQTFSCLHNKISHCSPTTMASNNAVGTSGTSATGLQWINYPGYNEAEKYKISAAVVVPPGRRLVATSGHVGKLESGSPPDDLEQEFIIAFDVRFPLSWTKPISHYRKSNLQDDEN